MLNVNQGLTVTRYNLTINHSADLQKEKQRSLLFDNLKWAGEKHVNAVLATTGLNFRSGVLSSIKLLFTFNDSHHGHHRVAAEQHVQLLFHRSRLCWRQRIFICWAANRMLN